MRKAQFWQYCTVRTAEQCMQQRTVDAINTAVGSRGRAQRAAGAVCHLPPACRQPANLLCVCASMRSARSACLLVARTARCFYHEGLPLAPSSCPSSPSRTRQALPALASLLAKSKNAVAPQAVWKRLLSSAEKLHPQAQPIGCNGNSKSKGNSNSRNAVACAPLHPQATAKAKATAGQCSAAVQRRRQRQKRAHTTANAHPTDSAPNTPPAHRPKARSAQAEATARA